MFSGFKSMIFGYSEPTQEAGESLAASGSGHSQENTSVLLEQTLNAATTKFTEQLLPQQASIEQLQSSSHQLLPTLNEQQELIKDKQGTTGNEIVCLNSATGEAEDDDLLADSWELLDLVVKRPTIDEVASVDDLAQYDIQIINNDLDEGNYRSEGEKLTKSSSGILKSSSKNQTNDLQQQEQQQARQKPKVSFETPHLVKGKQKIDRFNEPKQASNKNSRAKGCNKAKKSKQTAGKAKSVALVSKRDDKQDAVRPSPFPILSEPIEMVKKSPPLNYAAAVSAKQKDSATESVPSIESKPETDLPKSNEQTLAGLRTGKAIKRHRYNSTSSFSQNECPTGQQGDNVLLARNECNDDIESIMSSGFSDCDYEYKGLDDYVMRPRRSISKRGRNKASILSQKSKRTANNSTTASSGLNSEESKDSTGCEPVSVKSSLGQSTSTRTTQKATIRGGGGSSNSKASKSKKQRNADLSTSIKTSSADFLKPANPKLASMSSSYKVMSNFGESTHHQTTSNDSSDVAEMDESWYVTPPPCFTGANQLIAENSEMKLSPKNRGASVVSMENALIEHPSIYIASSKMNVCKNDARDSNSGDQPTTRLESSSCASPKATKPKPIVLRKVKKSQGSKGTGGQIDQELGCGHFFDANEDAMSDLDEFWATAYDKPESSSAAKQTTNKRTRARGQQVAGPKSGKAAKVEPISGGGGGKQAAKCGGRVDVCAQGKALGSSGSGSSLSSMATLGKADKKAVAWRNKFIVDDWDLDDQEDPASDFDDMFGPVRKKKAVRRALASNESQRKQQQRRSSAASLEAKSARGPSEPMACNNDDPKESNDEQPMGQREPSEQRVSGGAVLLEPSTTTSLELEDIASVLEGLKENQRLDLEAELASVELQLPATRRPPTQVQPIGPEKKPGWQLKRQRFKRRSLASSAGSSSPAGGKSPPVASARDSQQAFGSKSSSPANNSSASSVSSARSTPTLIDRIGSSIVANLNNLTSGFASVNPMLVQAPTGLILITGEQSAPANGDRQHQGPHVQAQQQELASRAGKLAALGESRANQLVGRKQMSKGFLKRQNSVSANQSSQRRADRRLRMFARPNGCSINRKVQTNY